MTRSDLCSLVHEFVTEDPESAPYIAQACSAGIREALDDAKCRAGDMEAALSVALEGRKRDRNGVILGMLKRWQDRSALKWDAVIARMEGKPLGGG